MSSTGPRIIYRTPDDVRAIPNETWERWIAARSIPWAAFAAESRTQRTMRWTLHCTARRMLAAYRG